MPIPIRPFTGDQCANPCGAGDVTLVLNPTSTTNEADFFVRSGHFVQVTILDGNTNISFLRVDSGDCSTGLAAPFTPCGGKPLSLCSAMRSRPIGFPGAYRLVSTAPAGTVTVQIEEFPLNGQDFVSLTCDCCAIDPCGTVAPPAPPVTASITPCPATFPAVWDFNGQTYSSLTALKAALDVFMGVTTSYTAATCTFTAPAGSVFPPLVLSPPVVIPPPVVYCPSIPLPDGGFGFHIADPKDPAATVEIAPCPGDTSTDSIWVYPSAATGRTAKVTDCDGNSIGYGVNQSDCAITCPCPDMNVTVNNAPVNNFSPTTNVAAPNITLPAPNVVAAGFDANGKLTITNSDGSTVQTADLPNC